MRTVPFANLSSTRTLLKNSLLLLTLLFGAATVQAQEIHVSRCEASPDALSVQQPDGSTITVIGKGNILINYTETVDGYTIVKNAGGIYEYAVPAQDGGLQPSGVAAHNPAERAPVEETYLKMQPLSVQYSAGKVAAILRSEQSLKKQIEEPEHGQDDKPVTASFPNTGKRKALLLLIEYPDLAAKYTVQNFKDMMNKEGYLNKGSFRDFYLQNSFGQLEVNADVLGWYMAAHNYKYYANDSGKTRSQELIAEAIDQAEAQGIDFSQYDNDGDGQVDGIMVVHSGPGAEVGSQNQYIWSHRWSLGSHKRKYDGVTLNNYIINPETRDNGNRMVGIGVFCHEFGHLLGLPDFYDITYESNGIGAWGLMGGGSWLDNENTPSCMTSFSKMKMNWITPVTITESGFYKLNPSSITKEAYIIPTPVSHEYFLLENRQFTGFDKKLRGKGLAIWHIDDSLYSVKVNSNSINTDKAHKSVDLEEADGKFDLDDKSKNNADNGDLYPGLLNVTSFDATTSPDSKNYNGKTTGVRIFGIKELSDSSVEFGFGPLPQAAFNYPAKVCQNQLTGFQNKSQYAKRYEWSFGDGHTDTTFNSTYTFTETGKYYIKLKAYDKDDNISEDSVEIEVLASPEADYSFSVNGPEVTFINKSLNGKSYQWLWGDGTMNFNSSDSFTRTFKELGTFDVSLIAVSQTTCRDTFTQQVEITNMNSSIAGTDKRPFKVYPVPFGDEIIVEYETPRNAKVDIALYDMQGRLLKQAVSGGREAGSGTYPVTLRELNLPAGMYILKISVDGNPYFTNLIKQ